MPGFAHDGVNLYYETAGRGAPLLLIAGLASDQAYWLPVRAALSQRRQVLLIDNRGSGRTTPLDADTSIEAMADDCMALVRHLGLPRVDIVGHSMGGMIAQACAWRDPDRVGALVLAATMAKCSPRNNDLFGSWADLYPVTERSWWFRNLYHWVLSPGFFDNTRTVDTLVQLATAYPYQQSARALRQQVAALAAFDGTAQLRAIGARTLVLGGTDDLLFDAAATAAFAAAVPGATLDIIQGAAHSFPAEVPDVFTSRVLAFLDRD